MPRDPVCGAEVPETTEYKYVYKGVTYYFCCPHCLAEFKKNPEKYASG